MGDHNPYHPPKSAVADSSALAITPTPEGSPIRWLLVLPVAIAAWFVSLFIGIVMFVGVEALCRSEVSGGPCAAPWSANLQYAVVAFGAGLAATLIMVSCTWLAPTHKRQTAIATFVVGTIVAIYLGNVASDSHIPMVAAIVAGTIVLAILLRRNPPVSPPNKSLERTRAG